MTAIRPAVFIWREVDVVDADGVASKVKAFVPEPRYVRMCEKQYALGSDWPLAPVENRDMRRHNGFFAAVHEAWTNLPEDQAKRFPDEDALRAWALVQTGYCDKFHQVCETTKDAVAFALTARKLSPYAVIVRSGNVVEVRVAKSQSALAMKPQEFYASKRDVIELLESMVGVKKGELMKNAGKAA